MLLLSGLLLVGGMLPALALAADPTPIPTPLLGTGGQAPTIVWVQDRPVGSTWSTAAVIVLPTP